MNLIKTNKMMMFFVIAIIISGLAVRAAAGSGGLVIDNPAAPVAASAQGEPRFMELPDKINTIVDRLSFEAPIHYYGFVSTRGQDVVIATPGEKNPERQPWRIEYYKNGEWQVLTFEKQVLEGLVAGAEVIVRVLPTVAGIVPDLPYKLVLGSYPVLVSYDLHDEPGVIRIPAGRTIPSWLATQFYKEARLEAKFTDSKGTPLEGAGLFLYVKFLNEERARVARLFSSDKEGRISQVIDFGRCEGGRQSDEFVENNRGFNTWVSYYESGSYFVERSMLGEPNNAPHIFHLGHICRQKLIETIAPRN